MTGAETLTVGVVGATGEVGQQMLAILARRNYPVGLLRPFASANSVAEGVTVDWQGKPVPVEDAQTADLSGIDIALFSAGAGVSRDLAPEFVQAGALVVDNSSAWRKDSAVPLVVSEVNPGALDRMPKGIVANPNCTTMIAMPVLSPLHQAAGLSSFKAVTFQAVSGAGRRGIDELGAQIYDMQFSMDDLASGTLEKFPKPEVFADTIAYNVVPINGDLVGDDTTEELKLLHESRRILDVGSLTVSATCVRVPVVTGHSLAVHARFQRPLSADSARDILSEAPGVTQSLMPTPLMAAGQDTVFVGRIRRDSTEANGLAMFISGDNLRKGAALNAIQIAELLLPRLLR